MKPPPAPPAQPAPLYRLPTYSHSAARGAILTAFVATALDVAFAMTAAASRLARRWGFSPLLGGPSFNRPPLPVLADLIAILAAIAAIAAIAIIAIHITGLDALARHAVPQRILTYLPALPILLPLAATGLLAAWLPLYSPLALVRWSWRYGHTAALAPGLAAARRDLLFFLLPLLSATLAATATQLAALRETGDSHGSSHWATRRELAASGLLARRRGRHAAANGDPLQPAVVVGAWHGRAPGDRRPRTHPLVDRRDRHVLAFAPSGSGKSSCLVVPTLLTWDSSAVILDVKGELWQLTAGYRSRAMGHRCLRLDLSCTDGSAAAYNPLLAVPRGTGDVLQAQAVADVLVDPDGRDRRRTFWEDSAHALLTALILHAVYAAPDEAGRTLAACSHLLANPSLPLAETLERLLTARHDPALVHRWSDPHSRRATHTHPTVAATARSLLDMDPRTSSGVVAAAQAHLALFRDPILAANTARSDFALLDLVAAGRPMSLYLTLAPAELDRLRGPVRLILNQLCRALTAPILADSPASPPPAPRRRPLLLLLDEFTALGRLDFFGRAMAYLRGYGIRVYLSIQALSQLHDIYGPHQSITANCPLQVAFAPADLETAELLSRLLGPTTIHLRRRALNGAPLAFGPRRLTLSLHEHQRPLLTAEEVRRLPDQEAIVLAAGHPPIRARRAPYYADPRAAALCRLPPPPPLHGPPG